jgi:hypothetical protein
MIGRLRGRSARELTDRTMHAVRVLADRLGFLQGSPLANLVAVPVSPFTVDHEGVMSLPTAMRHALVSRADAVLDGRFPLLGFEALRFGAPIDWQRDPLSDRRASLVHWSRVPYLDASQVGDHKLTWEVNRHQWVMWLAQAWLLTRDEKYVDAVVAFIDAWIIANPPKRGINWTSALELSFRTLAWTYALPLLADSPRVDLAFRHRVATSLLAQLEHVEWNRSTWFSPNTHLSGEALALLATGIAWPDLPGALRRRELGWRILCEQALIQHRPDGTYFEQTTWYQAYSVDIFVQALRWARFAGLGVPVDMTRRIHAAATALRAFARADGTIALLGDDDGGHLLPMAVLEPSDVSDVLARAAVHFNDPELTVPGCAGRWALVWMDSDRDLRRLNRLETERAAQRGRGSLLMRDGGWIVLHETAGGAWAGEHQLIFDAGPHGSLSCGHAHADALSICLTAHGVPFVVDPGTGAYVEPKRSYFRSTAVHATAGIDGLDSSTQSSQFRWTTIAQTRLLAAAESGLASWADAWHDGYERLEDPVRHRRIVGRLRARYWFLLDSIRCQSRHDVSIAFPVAPSAKVRSAPGDGCHSFENGGVVLHAAIDPRVMARVEWRRVSPAYGVDCDAQALVCSTAIESSTAFCTAFGSNEESGPLALRSVGLRHWEIAHRMGHDSLLAPLGEHMTIDGVKFDGTWMALLQGAPGDGSSARLLACGTGTLTFENTSRQLRANDTVQLHRLDSGWAAVGER